MSAASKPFRFWTASKDGRVRRCEAQRDVSTGVYEVRELDESSTILRRAPADDTEVGLRVQRDWRVELTEDGWQVE